MRIAFVCLGVTVTLAACGGGGTTDSGTPDGGAPDLGASRCTTDTDCDDGLFCDGPERCVPTSSMADARGCVATSASPCLALQMCNEAMRRCVTDCASPDADADGHRAMECGGDDCDDTDPLRFPGNVEVCDPLDHDEDCDAATFGNRDQDRDTFADATCCNVDEAGAHVCGTDCADLAASVHPGASEVCNGFDDDCNGMTDEGVTVAGFADTDGDLHGDLAAPRSACPGAAHFSLLSDDCDDHDVRKNGGQVEVCDGLDNDCDGAIDDDTRPVTWYADADGDGFGNARGGTMTACAPPAGYSLLPIDCDDTAMGVSPAALEQCNGRDDDCNGRADYVIGANDTEDDDADGATDVACGGAGTDCDDGDATVRPGAEPICDGRDHDCDGVPDTTGSGVDWLTDTDGDGWGTGTAIHQCAPVAGRVTRSGDCDDSTPARHPGALDVCNGVDDDCNGAVDDTLIALAFYVDADHDGAGGSTPILACAPPPGASLFPNDCDDADPRRYPGAPEVCNTLDDNCDGTVDESTSASLCALAGASSTHCSAGACVIDTCMGTATDCDGVATNGCESDLSSDPLHCGACGTPCPGVAGAMATCASMTCGFTCTAGHLDCDTLPGNGCETDPGTDLRNCGSCGHVCTAGGHATPTCAAMACAMTCDAGYTDCDSSTLTGCETHSDVDPLHCGGCSTVCGTGETCSGGRCYANPFPSDGTEGAYAPGGGPSVLPPGIHNFTTIDIPAGAVITTSGDTLELRATGAVNIAGIVDLTGGVGGDPVDEPFCSCTIAAIGGPGGGGATGNPLAVGATGIRSMCGVPGTGGLHSVGGDGGPYCAPGGADGGGVGGFMNAGGSGGGGPAGGAGGGGGGTPGVGGSIAGVTHGGVTSGQGGEPGLTTYAGANGLGRVGSYCNDGGGGGSIGSLAAADLAARTTFEPGSGGGGGSGWLPISCFCGAGGGGGGGGGGALRIASPVSITVAATGVVRADGGAGGPTGTSSGGGGGGSGGVVYLAAPSIVATGRVSAVGGAGRGVGECRGGTGGVGRIRLSLSASSSTLGGTFTPALSAGTTPTVPAVPGRTYVDVYPL